MSCRPSADLATLGFDFNCRVFAAQMGIIEDVATGAADCESYYSLFPFCSEIC